MMHSEFNKFSLNNIKYLVINMKKSASFLKICFSSVRIVSAKQRTYTILCLSLK